MDIPADLLQPDGFPHPGLYDCQPAPAPGVDLGCLYFYWNGVRYSARPMGKLASRMQENAAARVASIQQQQRAAASACFAGTPGQAPSHNILLDRVDSFKSSGIPATPQPTVGYSQLQLAELEARYETIHRKGYLKGFADAKALLLAVEPPKPSEDLSGLKGWDDPRAGQLQGQGGSAEASPTARYSYNERITYLESRVEKLCSMLLGKWRIS